MTAIALEGTRTRPRHAWLVPAAVVTIVLVVAWWASAPYLVGVFHDDGVYLLLAKAIASGQGFHYLQLPGTPAATHYPPLYPLLLALLWRVAPAFPENISLLLGVNVVCLGLAALGLYRLARRRLGWSEEGAALVALAAMLATPMLTLAGALLSEPLFLAALFPALLLVEETLEWRDVPSAVLSGLAVGALMLVRTHAVALLGAALLWMLVRRDWRRAALLAGAAAVVQLPWMLWTRSAPLVAEPLRGAYGSYGGWFVEGLRTGGIAMVLQTVLLNLREFWLLLGDRLLPGLPAPFGMVALWLAAILLFAGAVVSARRAPVTLLFVVLYLGIVLVMPYTPWRYAWGVWPLCVVFAVLGGQMMVERCRAPAVRAAALLVLALPALAMLLTEGRAYRTREWSRPGRNAAAQSVHVVEWVRRNTQPGDVVLTECEEIVTLFTGRHAAPPVAYTAIEYVRHRTLAEDSALLRTMIDAVPARYLLAISPQIQAAGRTMTGAPARLRELPGVPGAAIFEILR
jgi:hypothetical protein